MPPVGLVIIGLFLVIVTLFDIRMLRTSFPSCEVPALSVNAMTPAAASIGGGDRLEIHGEGFQPGTHVRIGSLWLRPLM